MEMWSQVDVCGYSREVALALLPKLKITELRLELGRRGMIESDDQRKAKGDMTEKLRKQMEKEYDELAQLKETWANEQVVEDVEHEQLMTKLRKLRDSVTSNVDDDNMEQVENLSETISEEQTQERTQSFTDHCLLCETPVEINDRVCTTCRSLSETVKRLAGSVKQIQAEVKSLKETDTCYTHESNMTQEHTSTDWHTVEGRSTQRLLARNMGTEIST